MQVLIFDSQQDVANFASALITSQIKRKPSTVLGLATGGTPLAIYKQLVLKVRSKKLSFCEVVTFNLDEYLGLAPTDSHSYRSYMNEHFFQHIDVDPANTHLPSCEDDTDPRQAAEEYERLITKCGGIDLQVLGIGRNGHIGFNEPTSSLASRTRVKTLSSDTVSDNSPWFEHTAEQPRLAMTMGIATILESTRILLIATGQSKANAVKNMIEGPLSSACPASALQLHRFATVLLDRESSALLKLTQYYQQSQQYQTELLERWASTSFDRSDLVS